MEFILGWGWEDHHVVVQFNDVDYFFAVLDPCSPLAGLEAMFLTYLPAVENHLYISMRGRRGIPLLRLKKLSHGMPGNKSTVVAALSPDDTLDFIMQTDPPGWG